MKVAQMEKLRLRMVLPVRSLLLISLLTVGGAAFQDPPPPDKNLIGRWQVNLILSGGRQTNLEFQAQPKGIGSFRIPEPDNQAVPATWSQTTNDRVNFSGEIEQQFSACCRETGTLIFKGKFKSNNTITGKAIFIATTENEENFTGYMSTVGTFTATRVP